MSSPITTPRTNRASRRTHARRGGAVGAGALLVTGSAAALLTAFAGSAGATSTITVDSNGDGNVDPTHCLDGTPYNCTLRDAALAAVDGDTITFDPSIANITLTNGTITTQAVNITGPGAAALTITTAGAPGLYDLFEISGTGNAVISGLTITKNRVKALNDGMFTLDGVTISGSTGAYGGALYALNGSELEIKNSRFENNTGTSNAGAVYIYTGHDATISGSVFTNNHADSKGGAVFTESSNNITITNCTVTGNTATKDGGGLSLSPSYAGAVVLITDTTIDANVADRWGGGINFESGGVTVNISNSTVSNNSATATGGILFNDTNITATINNSTISANAATVYGGGGVYINKSSSLTINQSTISENSAAGTTFKYGGGGILMGDNTSVVTMSGTIVSGNTSGLAGAGDIGLYSPYLGDTSSFTATHSLIGEVDTRIHENDPLFVAPVSSNLHRPDPMLSALADNGGPTKTMAPQPGSPAIDHGPNPVATFTGNSFDQRGTPWVRIYGRASDIGAVEVQPDPNSTTTTATEEPVAPAFTG